MKNRFQAGFVAFAIALVGLGATPSAFAKQYLFHVALSAKAETPPNDSKGTGRGLVRYDDVTHELAWNISYAGLTGPATAAHFHGPAAPGEAAGVVVPIKSAAPLPSQLVGSATLTPEQAQALEDGKLYFNVHTEANKGGELRGQVVAAGPKPGIGSVGSRK